MAESSLKQVFVGYLKSNDIPFDTYDNWVLARLYRDGRVVLVGYEFSSESDIMLMVNVANGVPAEAYDRVDAVLERLNTGDGEPDFKPTAQFMFDKQNGLVNMGFTAAAGSCCSNANNLISYGNLAMDLFLAAEPVIKAAIEG